MLVSRSTPAALVMIALAARIGGAQAATQPDAAAVYKQLSMFVYPAKGQSPEKQKKDEQECYTWAKNQTGFDPLTTAAPNADSAAKAAKEQTAQATQGSAVKGAAVGAAAGGVGGRAGKKRAEKSAAAEGSNAAVAESNKKLDTFKKAAGTCLEGRGYTLNK